MCLAVICARKNLCEMETLGRLLKKVKDIAVWPSQRRVSQANQGIVPRL